MFEPLEEENQNTGDNEKEQHFFSPPLYILYASILSHLLSKNGALISSTILLSLKSGYRRFLVSALKFGLW